MDRPVQMEYAHYWELIETIADVLDCEELLATATMPYPAASKLSATFRKLNSMLDFIQDHKEDLDGLKQ